MGRNNRTPKAATLVEQLADMVAAQLQPEPSEPIKDMDGTYYHAPEPEPQPLVAEAPVAAVVEPKVAAVSRTYSFRRRDHMRGGIELCSFGISGVQGIIFVPVSHFAVAPKTGDTLTLTATDTDTLGYTLRHEGTTKQVRSTYKVPGLKGTWTIHAPLVPFVDGTAPALLACNLQLSNLPVAAIA